MTRWTSNITTVDPCITMGTGVIKTHMAVAAGGHTDNILSTTPETLEIIPASYNLLIRRFVYSLSKLHILLQWLTAPGAIILPGSADCPTYLTMYKLLHFSYKYMFLCLMT